MSSVTENYNFARRKLGHSIRDTDIGDTLESIDTILKTGEDENLATDLLLSTMSQRDIFFTVRTSAADNNWYGVAYGNGLFVAVASTDTGNRVMTSPDGITWTIRTSAADNDWQSIAYGNGLFVAVAITGTGDRVMTSPDGITWTIRTSAADNNWLSVAYGNGLFVAVAKTGTGDRVMTSPDGITWTIRTSAADNEWYGVAYGNGLFVAVAKTGTGDRVMTSPDGITWTIRTSAADNEWKGIAYGNGLFVAAAITGTGDRVMTSPDGITWTIRTSAADNNWYGVAYGNGLFVAVASSGTGDRVMTSDAFLIEVKDGGVDISQMVATLLKGIVMLSMSFETDELTATEIYFPYKVTINKIRSIVMLAVAATDDGTITGANSVGDSDTGVVTVAASSALNVKDDASPTSNNVVAADSYYKLTTAKSTKGGKVLVTLEYTRTA